MEISTKTARKLRYTEAIYSTPYCCRTPWTSLLRTKKNYDILKLSIQPNLRQNAMEISTKAV
jgi:hypothetical protein